MRWVVIVALLLGAACRKSQPSSDGAAVAQLRVLADQMCACKDAACAQTVSKKMTAWNADQASGGTPTLGEADTTTAQKVSDELGSCMLKALSTGSGAPTDVASGAANSAPGSGSGATVDPTPPEGSASGSSADAGDVPQECKDYKAAVERIQPCEAVPKAARDTLRASFDKASAGWQKLGSRDHLRPSCKSADRATFTRPSWPPTKSRPTLTRPA